MWFGLLHLPPGEAAEDHPDGAILVAAWKPGGRRPFTIGAEPTAAPDILRLLRALAADDMAIFAPPACWQCGIPLDVPGEPS